MAIRNGLGMNRLLTIISITLADQFTTGKSAQMLRTKPLG